MIRSSLEKRGGDYCLSALGHANYAPYGQDLICAAVSALFHGLLSYLEEMERRGLLRCKVKGRLERGRACIGASPKWRAAGEIRGAFLLAGQILCLLSRHYPDNIQFSLIEEEEIIT